MHVIFFDATWKVTISNQSDTRELVMKNTLPKSMLNWYLLNLTSLTIIKLLAHNLINVHHRGYLIILNNTKQKGMDIS